jgi:hypothetical protein
MSAALAGTLAANLFYLTMTFYYVYVFAVLALALPVMFARHPVEARGPVPAPRRREQRAPAVGVPAS